MRDEMEDTLMMLNLKNKFNCTFVPETDDYGGMLKKVKDFIAWGEVDEDVVKEVLQKRSKIEDVDKVVEGLDKGMSLGEMDVQRSFSLSPPSGGFSRSTKEPYPKGEVGYRGDEIIQLIERMV